MASIDTAQSPSTTAPAVRLIALYESAMCCETGVCGPAVDEKLVDVREDLRWAENEGATVSRHNLASDPDAFVANPKVTGLMQAFGERALPVLVVDGDIALHGHYPSRTELAEILGANATEAEPKQSGGCGCGPGGC